jgi:thioredoxin-dependent peroxiredoxin
MATKKTTPKKTSQKPTARPANTPPGSLEVGAPLPAFQLINQAGKLVDAESLKGKRLVLYFYPKDDTPGCTREACGFQEGLGQIKKLKAQVVGVSSDSVERHQKFAAQYGLSFPLLVDADKVFANACGVIGEKVLYGKRSVGVIRSTFIIDEAGTIRRIFRNVKVDGHLEEVLAALKEL